MNAAAAARRVLLAAGLPLALLGLWWLASADSQSFYLPPLRDILAAFADTWLGGRLADDVLPSVVRLLAGFAVATVVGVGLGVAIGSSPRRRAALEPVLEFLGPSRRRSWCRSSSACGTWCCGQPARRSSPGCARRCRSASS